MSILPPGRRRRVRRYVTALERRRAVEERRFREFAGMIVLRATEVSR
ncbi:hypothetical protein HNR23_002946 [Nocardiopsis mwathae]|uniref:Uncharacterized protein n=1 Tax=Nocardiopsis mwathae TaxID=1472723 RepID=A0A7W9YKJ8_9ACTN|nr:hypothetical protein [Nocardiopsis mwathae]MBB6172886.1 hypothetical protein [Nocardiopsis mwathae]